MFSSEKTLQIIEVELLNTINAGKLCAFPTTLQKKVFVAVPTGINPKHIETFIVSGDSMSGDDIYHGYVLIYKSVFTWEEVKPDKICAVYLLSTSELLAKKIIRNEDGTVTLRSSNPDYPDRVIPENDIEVRGVAIGFQKLFR